MISKSDSAAGGSRSKRRKRRSSDTATELQPQAQQDPPAVEQTSMAWDPTSFPIIPPGGEGYIPGHVEYTQSQSPVSFGADLNCRYVDLHFCSILNASLFLSMSQLIIVKSRTREHILC